MKLVEMLHGSRLYGTHSDASDYDYKGVALPSVSQILRGQIPKIIEKTSPKKAEDAKNQPGDVEREIYSLHYFIDLCLQGQTVAIDMLHAPWPDAIVFHDMERVDSYGVTCSYWAELVINRSRFYTRKMTALVGYARHQAAKYGIKGSRLATVKKVRAAMLEMMKYSLFGTVGEFKGGFMPVDVEHVHLHAPSAEHNGIGMLEVCGMKLQDTVKVSHYLPTLDKFISNYGERAKQAESNQGIDWKAVSHAFRAGFQMKAILTKGGFTYPLPETAFLKDIKSGIVPYSSAGPELERLIDEVEVLATVSELPDAPDEKWAYDFLERVTKEHVTGIPDEEGNVYPPG